MRLVSSQFCGRETQLREIVPGVLATQPTGYAIIGPDYVGKSRLLRDLVSADGPLSETTVDDHSHVDRQVAACLAIVYLDCGDPETLYQLHDSLKGALAGRLAQFADGYDWPDDETPESTYQIVRHLNRYGCRPLILLDNFDRVPSGDDVSEKFIESLLNLCTETALVLATRYPLHDLSSAPASIALSNALTSIFLGLVEIDVAQAWIADLVGQLSTSTEFVDFLLAITGRHPFLIHSIDGVLAELNQFLPAVTSFNEATQALLRLRLAEHGRPLFLTQWNQLQSPPAHVPGDVVERVLIQLCQAPIDLTQLSPDEGTVINWLFNQAVLTWDSDGCHLYSPLFVDFLASRLARQTPEIASINLPQEALPDLLIYEQLTKTEVNLLRYFQQHDRKIVPPEQLLADVWRRPDASPRRVQEAIRRLRLQLANADPPVGVIENERGRGYRFVPVDAT